MYVNMCLNSSGDQVDQIVYILQTVLGRWTLGLCIAVNQKPLIGFQFPQQFYLLYCAKWIGDWFIEYNIVCMVGISLSVFWEITVFFSKAL